MGHRRHKRGSGRQPDAPPPSRLVVLAEDTADNLEFIRAVIGQQLGREISRDAALDTLVHCTAHDWAEHVAFTTGENGQCLPPS